MQQFNRATRMYLISCYLLGVLALGWFLFGAWDAVVGLEDWLVGVVLALAAATCQVFVVQKARSNRSDHLTPAPVFAALLLVPSPVLALALIVPWLPEWYLYRRKWFIQLWNIAAYLIAGALARFVLFQLTGYEHLDSYRSLLSFDSSSVFLVIPVFLGTHTVLLASVLKLARGQSFHEGGLFALDKLLSEVALLCIGLCFAIAWVVDPLYGIAAVLPLILGFKALHVPNLMEEASTDPKTGLANMRHFNAAMARDLERAGRSGQPVSFLMCDLDYLRNINNTYGHQAGDMVLIGIADIIRRNIRASDVAARFGGEEFAVLLTDTDAAGAQQVAERIRSELELTRFDLAHTAGLIGATISIGTATYPHDGRTPEGLLREADLAVYQAKREGRNRVVAAGRVSRELAGEWAREHLVSAPVRDSAPQPDVPRPFWKFISEATRVAINTEERPVPQMERVVRRSIDSAHQHGQTKQRRQDLAPRVLLLIGTIVIVGLLGAWPVLNLSPTEIPWWPLLLFAGLTVVACQLAVDTFGKGKTSVGVVVILSAAFLYHELGILTTALAAAVTLAFKARSQLHRVLFNFGTFLVSAEGGLAMFKLLGGESISKGAIAHVIVPAVVAGLVYYLVNHLLLCLVRSFTEQRRVWEIWHSDYRWLWPHYPVLGGLALVTALGFVAFGWIGVIALMSPVVMMHVAIKQYTDRTTVYVNELQHVNNRLTDSYEATLQALTRALDTRDDETQAHSQRVKCYTEVIARQLGVSGDELANISRGALLHDIGKIGVPDAILLKPGQLTDEERTQMRKHPEIGYGMIAHIPFLSGAAQVVLHHHEAYDGSGYPSGLAGANIPLGSRIFAVADTFDAMTSDRPYRKARSYNEACAELKRCCGTQFDPRIVDAFLAIPIAELLAIRPDLRVPTIERDQPETKELALVAA